MLPMRLRVVALAMAVSMSHFAGCLTGGAEDGSRPRGSVASQEGERHACVGDPWMEGGDAGPPDEECPFVARVRLLDAPERLYDEGARLALSVSIHAGTARMGAPLRAGVHVTGAEWIGEAPSFHGDVRDGQEVVLEGVLKATSEEVVLRGFAALSSGEAQWAAPGGRALSVLGVRGDSATAAFFTPTFLPEARLEVRLEGDALVAHVSSSLPSDYRLGLTAHPRLELDGPDVIAGRLEGAATHRWRMGWSGPSEDGNYSALHVYVDHEPHVVPVRNVAEVWVRVQDGRVVDVVTERPVEPR